MEALHINSATQIIEKIEVDPSEIANKIDKDCNSYRPYLRIYLTDKDNRQRKYLLYADENAVRLPFKTSNLNFFCLGSILIQGNGLIVQDYSEKGDGIIDTPISSVYKSGEINLYASSEVSWPNFETVAKMIADNLDPLSESIYLEVANQKHPLLKHLERIEEANSTQESRALVRAEIDKMRSDIEKYYGANIELLTRFRRLIDNYNFFKNRRPKSS